MKDRRAARMEYQEILGRQTEGSLTEQDYRRMLILHRRLTYDDVRRCYAEEERRQPYANVQIASIRDTRLYSSDAAGCIYASPKVW